MYDWVLKTPLKASTKASTSLTFLALAAIWLNTFFPSTFVNFYFFQYSKTIFKFCFLIKTFIFIQTNIYVKTCASMQISGCRQDKTTVPDNFKRNLHHFSTSQSF